MACDSKKINNNKKKRIKRKYWKRRRKKNGVDVQGWKVYFGKAIVLIGGRLEKEID